MGSIVGEQEIPGPAAGVAARFRPTGGGQDPGEVAVGVFESEPRRAGRITVGQKSISAPVNAVCRSSGSASAAASGAAAVSR